MKTIIENAVKDLVNSFLYYDRKEDEDLPYRAIEYAIEDGTITKEEIVKLFSSELDKGLES